MSDDRCSKGYLNILFGVIQMAAMTSAANDSVMSIVEEQGCFQTKLRIVGNSNKLIYFRRYLHDSTKLLHIKTDL